MSRVLFFTKKLKLMRLIDTVEHIYGGKENTSNYIYSINFCI
jgi:hypothetical protein